MNTSNTSNTSKYFLKNSFKINRPHETKQLITDDLEEKYGPICTKVIRHDEDIRVCHLIDKSAISRTFAVTFFVNKEYSTKLAKIDCEIKLGNPIGKTLRKYQFSIYKNIIDSFIVELPEWLKNAFVDKTDFAKCQLLDLIVLQKNTSLEAYGIIAEIYCPNFMPFENIEIKTMRGNSSINSLLISPNEIILVKKQLYDILKTPHV